MRWKTKALVQTVFSRVPGGESLNFLCQRRLLRSLPVPDSTFRTTVATAKRHLDNLRSNGSIPVSEARFYEFGAGKDLIIPVAFYCLGVNDQMLVDIRPMAREELVVDTLRRLHGGIVTGLDRTPAPALAVEGLGRRLAALGIRYKAPCDARDTGLRDGTMDYITSSSTLEHIPAPDIRMILRESRRILAPDGRLSLLIDYQDHYSYADTSISAFNFLKYEDEEWQRWSPALQFQNRLRHSDYLDMFEDEGFEVVDDVPAPGSPEDLEVVRALPVASRFRNHSEQDLAIRGSLITLKKGGAGSFSGRSDSPS